MHMLTVKADLSLEELDVALIKDPHRHTEFKLRRLTEMVKNVAEEAKVEVWDVTGTERRRLGALPPKLIRLIKEVQTYPGGKYAALHLYIFLIAKVFYLLDMSAPYGRIGSDMDSRAAESLLLNIANESRRKIDGGAGLQERIFFNFSLAKRAIWNSLPAECSTCASRAMHPLDPPFDDPCSPCRRGNVLILVERLQEEAYGEIKSGIMLTLASRLPKELCLLVSEFALVVEEIPIDPTVFEHGESSADRDSHSTHRSNWSAKAKYRCRESLDSSGDREDR